MVSQIFNGPVTFMSGSPGGGGRGGRGGRGGGRGGRGGRRGGRGGVPDFSSMSRRERPDDARGLVEGPGGLLGAASPGPNDAVSPSIEDDTVEGVPGSLLGAGSPAPSDADAPVVESDYTDDEIA
ncbi:hypothetical protein LX32DRAFT_682285 [Colletotrichum zoysiae]|uniref:Uncharacterized protein n=1 Tax=Colletotrichum zoysiae TaxID=1216348 RepID=A0AAD9M5X7_9PEZI|nr:hypothetical protein LX32DRAFT_682285 [Colletotrichum zoysiae]